MISPQLPTFFAATLPTVTRRVWLFDAVLIVEPDSGHYSRQENYRVRPSTRFARWANEHPGFLIEEGRSSDWHERTTLIVDRPPRHGRAAELYHGGYMLPPDAWDRTREVPMRWRYAGAKIYSMLCPDPIPLIVMERPEMLPMIPINEFRISQVTRPQESRIMYRVWGQRWDPLVIAQDIERFRAALDARRRRERTPSPPRPIAGAVAPVPAQQQQPQQGPTPLPKFVADALIRDAVAADAICPITMEPITSATAAVTSCFHVFDANAIAIWLADNHTCPTCKTPAAT